jgi:hypothetical protein
MARLFRSHGRRSRGMAVLRREVEGLPCPTGPVRRDLLINC